MAEEAEDESGWDQERARQMSERRALLDAQLDREPRDAARAEQLLSRLDAALADADSHVQSGECGQTLCRVDVIHETDLAALDFSPDRIMEVTQWGAEVFVDRSEEDGMLTHVFYFRAPHTFSEAEKRAIAELGRRHESAPNEVHEGEGPLP